MNLTAKKQVNFEENNHVDEPTIKEMKFFAENSVSQTNSEYQ